MKIFRFQPISNLSIQNLIDQKNWVADPYKFNDPFEFSLIDPFYYTDEGIPQMISKVESNNLEKVKEKIKEFGVVCYSKSFQNHLLWSHYSDNHKGMCLVFDTDFNDSNDLFEVSYQKEFPLIDLKSDADLSKKIQKVVTTKSIEWKYENELRQVFKFKNKLHDFPGKLVEIIFGCRTSREKMEHILDLSHKINNDIKISRMRIVRNEYLLGKMTSENNKKIPHIWNLDIKYSKGLFNYR